MVPINFSSTSNGLPKNLPRGTFIGGNTLVNQNSSDWINNLNINSYSGTPANTYTLTTANSINQ
jgi:hypothetical protein